ncbi:putative alcohol dehydrogenase [Actinoplanes missouriensis 431]|uniref:Putative alcohol dehydrogenase n=1 Tax=Actinoplanes missouriensis (strain ATCC 14538 / DSM 43046 / CBS 188.64 / JCM 3121 / NBRC 102363 / NCIMB 12654 / NRRL B-3342 / UNCC 431) TaxID=512565 RepID=I0H693_ACTM4|nr:NADPH:quinone reductase [Actinoplanes missouriensis]BAL88530.1 putative alcohol dehydrogenase [Actinoplanes missouriensis 431]
MKTIVFSGAGDSTVLSLVERDLPEPGDGQIRVRVHRSGVNPTDWKRRSAGDPGFPEVTPNMDGAGVVDAVGPGVLSHAVGDRVWVMLAAHGSPYGTAAEHTIVPAAHALPLPEGTSFDTGAALGVPAVTAHRALTVAEGGPSRLEPGALDGRTVLVAGGAGAVGHAAIQLARWAGASVVTTVSSAEKAALARAAGAHHVVDYTGGEPAAEIRAVAPDGVDIVVEVSAARNAPLNQAVAANHATIAIYANNGGDTAAFDIRPHMMLNTRVQFLILYTVGEAALQAAAEDVGAALRDGALPVGEEHGLPLHHFPLERAADAHDAVERGIVGKVLITV